MIYPKFVTKNSTIGICAPSAGVGRKIDDYLNSLAALKAQGFKIVETKSVRKNNERSAGAKQRAIEIDELVLNNNVDAISCAAGGDYMYEVVPYINFDNIQKNPKWLLGMSDPTNLLYIVTTKLDIATMYGFNGGSYPLLLDKPSSINLAYLQGKITKQKSYKKYQSFIDKINGIEKYNHNVNWISKKNCEINGRIIGGCLDVIRTIIGTEYDYTKSFIEKYKNDGIIWYFDIFSMTVLDFYLTMLQFKNAGYFKYCKGVLIGRIAFEQIENPKFNYINAADKALGKIPHICEMDIGHTKPGMTIINGAICKVEYREGKGSISFKLK